MSVEVPGNSTDNNYKGGLMDSKMQQIYRTMGLDPMSGRKLKISFTIHERRNFFHNLKRSHAKFIYILELTDENLLKMIDDIKNGFVNSRIYHQKHFKEFNYKQFLEIFNWISRKLTDYK